jgi:hypothetical protein
MGKRKASSSLGSESKKGKTTTLSVLSKEPENVKAAFRDDLFDKKVLKEYNEQYTTSGPYETFNFSTEVLLTELQLPPCRYSFPNTLPAPPLGQKRDSRAPLLHPQRNRHLPPPPDWRPRKPLWSPRRAPG